MLTALKASWTTSVRTRRFPLQQRRFYTADVPDHPDEEIWMFIDHFDDSRKYRDSLTAAVTNDPTTQQHFQRCMALTASGHMTDIAVWTEAEQLRVDF